MKAGELVHLVFTTGQVQVIVDALGEMRAKIAYPVLRDLFDQVNAQKTTAAAHSVPALAPKTVPEELLPGALG